MPVIDHEVNWNCITVHSQTTEERDFTIISQLAATAFVKRVARWCNHEKHMRPRSISIHCLRKCDPSWEKGSTWMVGYTDWSTDQPQFQLEFGTYTWRVYPGTRFDTWTRVPVQYPFNRLVRIRHPAYLRNLSNCHYGPSRNNRSAYAWASMQ
jgi:hypothetical protein